MASLSYTLKQLAKIRDNMGEIALPPNMSLPKIYVHRKVTEHHEGRRPPNRGGANNPHHPSSQRSRSHQPEWDSPDQTRVEDLERNRRLAEEIEREKRKFKENPNRPAASPRDEYQFPEAATTGPATKTTGSKTTTTGSKTTTTGSETTTTSNKKANPTDIKINADFFGHVLASAEDLLEPVQPSSSRASRWFSAPEDKDIQVPSSQHQQLPTLSSLGLEKQAPVSLWELEQQQQQQQSSFRSGEGLAEEPAANERLQFLFAASESVSHSAPPSSGPHSSSSQSLSTISQVQAAVSVEAFEAKGSAVSAPITSQQPSQLLGERGVSPRTSPHLPSHNRAPLLPDFQVFNEDEDELAEPDKPLSEFDTMIDKLVEDKGSDLVPLSEKEQENLLDDIFQHHQLSPSSATTSQAPLGPETSPSSDSSSFIFALLNKSKEQTQTPQKPTAAQILREQNAQHAPQQPQPFPHQYAHQNPQNHDLLQQRHGAPPVSHDQQHYQTIPVAQQQQQQPVIPQQLPQPALPHHHGAQHHQPALPHHQHDSQHHQPALPHHQHDSQHHQPALPHHHGAQHHQPALPHHQHDLKHHQPALSHQHIPVQQQQLPPVVPYSAHYIPPHQGSTFPPHAARQNPPFAVQPHIFPAPSQALHSHPDEYLRTSPEVNGFEGSVLPPELRSHSPVFAAEGSASASDQSINPSIALLFQQAANFLPPEPEDAKVLPQIQMFFQSAEKSSASQLSPTAPTREPSQHTTTNNPQKTHVTGATTKKKEQHATQSSQHQQQTGKARRVHANTSSDGPKEGASTTTQHTSPRSNTTNNSHHSNTPSHNASANQGQTRRNNERGTPQKNKGAAQQQTPSSSSSPSALLLQNMFGSSSVSQNSGSSSSPASASFSGKFVSLDELEGLNNK